LTIGPEDIFQGRNNAKPATVGKSFSGTFGLDDNRGYSLNFSGKK